jgi:hypothetical protein
MGEAHRVNGYIAQLNASWNRIVPHAINAARNRRHAINAAHHCRSDPIPCAAQTSFLDHPQGPDPAQLVQA